MYSLYGFQPKNIKINNTHEYKFTINVLKVFIALDFLCTRPY